jgi:hypothetical protein
VLGRDNSAARLKRHFINVIQRNRKMQSINGTSVDELALKRATGSARKSSRHLAFAIALPAILGALAFSGSAQSSPVGGNANYIIVNNCQSIDGLTVSLQVTHDMVETASAPGGGFAMQLNAYPPAGQPVWALQYGIFIQNNQAFGFIQYWDNAGINNHNEPVIRNLPSNTIPAGWILTIAMTNDSSGNVTGTTFSVTDEAGNTSTLQMPMPVYPNTTTPVLAPIEGFQLDVVGPINDESSTFSSGAGYITYGTSSGQLSVQGAACSNASENWYTLENSNSLYGAISPGVGTTLVQPFATPFSGVLASNMDTAGKALKVYQPVPNAQTGNFNLDQYAFTGSWAETAAIANAVVGSPIVSYEDTLTSEPEVFYLFIGDPRVGATVEQLSGESLSPSSLTVLANAQAAAVSSGLAAYVDPLAGSDNIFYQGTDQHVHLLTWSPGLTWTQDTRMASAPAAAFASALTGHMNAESEELFYLGSNQHIYELWRWSLNFDGWHSTDVTMANQSKPLAAVGSPLAGFYDAKAGSDAVFYIGTDQHVHELLFVSGTWTGIDVTSASGAPLAGAGSTLAAHLNTIAGSEEVFFVDANQNVQELWSWSTAAPAWHPSNVTLAAGAAVLANPGSPLTADIDSVASPNTDEVYYVGTDGLVHQLSWNGRWSTATP